MSVASTKPLRIACFGEAMAELSVSGGDISQSSLDYGGDTMNTAIYLKRLMGDDAGVSYLTVVGNDALSSKLIEKLDKETINTSAIGRHNEKQIGIYSITTDDSGERTFDYWRSDSAARTLFQDEGTINFDILSNYDVIYFSGISLAILPKPVREALIQALQNLRQSQKTIIAFDSNYRPVLWESIDEAQRSISAAWEIADIALPSIDDEQKLFGDANEAATLQRFKQAGVKQGALKRGEEGPVSLSTDAPCSITRENIFASVSEPVSVVDTTAAGDSFNAAYISTVLRSGTQADALQAGHACAARVIAFRGAIVPKEQW